MGNAKNNPPFFFHHYLLPPPPLVVLSAPPSPPYAPLPLHSVVLFPLFCHAAAPSALARCHCLLRVSHQSLPSCRQGQGTEKGYVTSWKYNLVRLQELFNEEGCEAKLWLNEDMKPYMYIVDCILRLQLRMVPPQERRYLR